MSLARRWDRGLIVFRCDTPNCLAECDTQVRAYGEANEFATKAGWKGALLQGVTHHFCPECVNRMGPYPP